MTPDAITQASTSLLAQVANPAARALALGCAAGLGLTAFRVKTTSVRLITWTAVLYAAVAMPGLGWMLPPLPVPTPVFLQPVLLQPAFLQQRSPQPAPTRESSWTPAAAPSPAATGQIVAARKQAAAYWFRWSSIQWNTLAAGIYLAGALLFLARFMVGLVFSRRLVRASQSIDEARVIQRLTLRAFESGLAFLPQAAESEFISVPVTMGALRSTILLPSAWREWDDTKLDAVVAHEMSHVARRDALTQRLSLLHRAIFWFSPLAWWLNRHLADLAEQASDEAALSCGADRNDYARTLLGFFEALQATSGRVWWQGVAMAKAGQAEQRVERILNWKGSVPMRLKKSIWIVALVLAVPAAYLAASAHPAGYAAEPQHLPLGQDQTVPPAASAEPGAAVAPMAALAPATARAQSGSESSSDGQGYSYAYGYDEEQRFVIASGKTDTLTMSGSTEDARHVEKLRKQISGDFIWFERDEKSYIIRDQATIDRARKLWAPQEEIGKKQEELGKQQEALGKQQEELGSKMEQVKVNVPDMTAELDKLKAELKQLRANATVDQVGHIQSEIGELQSKVGELQSQAGEQQSKVGEQMSALGEKQGKLGEKQSELGRLQSELAREAVRRMKQIFDEAIKNGIAQPEI
jgi:beta-lactamase regulating signal transducer with metallopeptidase domain